MLSERGFVTQALLSVQFQCQWSRYRHWITHGKWHWKSLACRLIQLVCSHAQKRSSDGEPITLALDDWVVERFPIRFLLVEYITSTARSEIAPPISGVCVGSHWLLFWSAQWMKSSQALGVRDGQMGWPVKEGAELNELVAGGEASDAQVVGQYRAGYLD